MVTVLDCIQRVPSILENILANRKETTRELLAYLDGRVSEIDELVFIGSGTSNTSAWTSRNAVARMARLRVTTVLPNEFLYERPGRNRNALYLFTSQSGNSILTRQCLRDLKEAGYLTCGITEGPETDIAKEAAVHVDMGCGKEEYGCRTIGFCASVLTHMVIGLELGLASGRLTQAEYDAYMAQAGKVPASNKSVCEKALAWFDRNEKAFADAGCYVLYGGGSLWGVAQEGALKIMEMARRIAIGYEVEDGLHGPNISFDKTTCIVALDGCEPGSAMAEGCARFAKDNCGAGFLIGGQGVDDSDLCFDVVSEDFRALEFAPAVQVLAYRLAGAVGIDLTAPIPLPEKRYFELHDEP